VGYGLRASGLARGYYRLPFAPASVTLCPVAWPSWRLPNGHFAKRLQADNGIGDIRLTSRDLLP